MTRYFRLSEEADDGSRQGNRGEINGYGYEVTADDLLQEPTSQGGALQLNDVNNMGDVLSAPEDEGHEPPRSGFCYWYARFLVRFSVLFCFVLLALTAAGGAVAFVLYDLPSFDNPLDGFEARGTEIRDRLSGLDHFYETTNDTDFHQMFRRSLRSANSIDATATGIPSSSSSSSSQDDDASSSRDEQSEIDANTTPENDDYYDSASSHVTSGPSTAAHVYADSAPHRTLFIFTLASADDFFNAPALRSMCNIYHNDLVTNDSDVLPYIGTSEPASLGLYAAILNGKSSCSDVDDSDAAALKQRLHECAPFYSNGTLSKCQNVRDCPELPVNCTEMSIVYNSFYYLLPKGSAAHMAQENYAAVRYSLMVSPLSKWGSTVQDLYTNNIMGRVVSDGITKLCAVEGGFKFDLFSDLLISDFKYMAMGIGLILVLVWLYTSSLFVTVMTILDMVMSLVFAYFLYVVIFGMPFFPFINVLAVVLVIGIGADDAFVYVDIWRKMKEKHGGDAEKRVQILQETLHHAVITMFVTSFTTSSALFSNILSSITDIRCLAVYAGCAIMINFVYTVTWLPAIVIVEDRYLQCRRCTTGIQRSSCFSKVKECSDNLTRSIRALFENVIPALVFKLRYLWLVSLMLLGVGGAYAIFVMPKIHLPTKNEFQVFVLSDYLEQYDQKLKPMFAFEQSDKPLMPILFIWGLRPLDNGDAWDPFDSGTIVVDRTFNSSSKAGQKWMLDFCREIREQHFYAKGDSWNNNVCFVEILKSRMEEPCEMPYSQTPCCNHTTFPYEPAVFTNCTALLNSADPKHQLDQVLRFGQSNELTGLMLSFTSTTEESVIYENMSEFWYTIDTWSKQKMATAPAGLAGGWFVSQRYDQMYFFDLQESLATGTPLSIGVSLGVAALVLLLTTRNVLLTLYAILSISATVFVTIGSLVLMGWELNVLESTIMCLAVGLSVDFTIHYGVAYRICRRKDRLSRSTFAMKQLTSAITTAALSTFIAGAVMLPSSVLCYRQIGIFLVLVMSVSWIYANFFFMSLCRTLGPEGNCTQIPAPSCAKAARSTCGCCRNACCCCTRQRSSTILNESLVGDIDLGYPTEY